MDEKIFSQYLKRGKEAEVTLPDGSKQTIQLKPLGMKNMPKLFKVFESFREANEENMVEHLNEESMTQVMDLVYHTLVKSYPDVPEEALAEMAANNFMELFPIVIELNSGYSADRNDIMKKRLKEIRDAKSATQDKGKTEETTTT